MRYPGAEKLEIIRLVEQSPLPATSDPEQTRYSPSDVLSLVRPVQQGRAGRLKRSAAPSGSAVEPHSGRGARKRDPAGA